MILLSDQERRRAFNTWLRTGRLPSVRNDDGIEIKFNPWHDPDDGRFTFAGTGRHFGRGEAQPASGTHDRAPQTGSRGGRTKQRPEARRPTQVSGAGRQAKHDDEVEKRGANEARRARHSATSGLRPVDRPNPVRELAAGVGEGLSGVAKGAATGVYSALTTNPVTTLNDVGHGIAGTIDAAIAAEDTPARVQLSRAADAVANASARDIGRTVGSTAGNAALLLAPGAAASKISTLRRLRMTKPGVSYDPPKIGWVKETLKSNKKWKIYNDSAPGARPGQAPTLMRTMSDKSERPVKFDGVQGEFVIDRKWSVSDRARALDQLLRQSEVLKQHNLIGIYEVPYLHQKTRTIKIFKKRGITNIKVRIVEP